MKRWSTYGVGLVALLCVAGIAVVSFGGRSRSTPTPRPSPPQSSADDVQLREPMKAYLEQTFAPPSPGARSVCSLQQLGDEDVRTGTVRAFLWAYCQEFVPRGSHAELGRTKALPVALTLRLEGEKYVVQSHEAPGQDEQYERDIRRIFPKSLRADLRSVPAIATAPRIEALESLRTPLHIRPDVGGAAGPYRVVLEDKTEDVTWKLLRGADVESGGRRGTCLRIETARPSPPSAEDTPSVADGFCAEALSEQAAVVKAAEGFVLDAGYNWAYGFVHPDADAVEALMADNTRQTWKVSGGLWAGVYASFTYVEGLRAMRGGTLIGSCGGQGAPPC
ncbi:MAG TPA: hypothetical protein VNE62_10470 [Actinomycetota bacterium]|nr:hypothetical protein [Actinomycetota bacterium]